jgi:hypothetical protein
MVEVTAAESTVKIAGRYNLWTLNGHTRAYADVSLPYRQAVEFVQPVRYNAQTGKGEQRELLPSHAKKLHSEMVGGTYVPTQMTASLRENHRQNLSLDAAACTFDLLVKVDDPLPQTDGSHRYAGLALRVRELKDKLARASAEEKSALEASLDEVMNLPIGVRIFFDGDPQQDFLALQQGRTVDAAHLLSMKIQKGVTQGDTPYKLAFDAANHLNKHMGPFHGLIRFDSQDEKGALVKRLPISTLCTRAASDLSTSLVGLAKVGSEFGANARFLAGCVKAAHETLQQQYPSVLEAAKVITPVMNGGTKGSATMLLGVGLCLAYRLLTQERKLDEAGEDLTRLVESVARTLDRPVEGNFSAQTKRVLMGEFARDFLGDLPSLHDGIPVDLLKIIPPSAWNATALPKPPRKKVSKKQLPDVDGPVEQPGLLFDPDGPEVTENHLENVVEGEADPFDVAFADAMMG